MRVAIGVCIVGGGIPVIVLIGVIVLGVISGVRVHVVLRAIVVIVVVDGLL